MARDRTARSRIRDHLAQYGPVADSHGLATHVLKDAVAYEGSPVAFIQLLAAMERDGELQRDIRGKRTYRIAAPTPAPGAQPAGVLDPPSSREVDYDVLARMLLHELAGPTELEETRAENRRIAQERDDYARRLELARAMLDELRASVREARSDR
jgi:hypothetical protein